MSIAGLQAEFGYRPDSCPQCGVRIAHEHQISSLGWRLRHRHPTTCNFEGQLYGEGQDTRFDPMPVTMSRADYERGQQVYATIDTGYASGLAYTVDNTVEYVSADEIRRTTYANLQERPSLSAQQIQRLYDSILSPTQEMAIANTPGGAAGGNKNRATLHRHGVKLVDGKITSIMERNERREGQVRPSEGGTPL